MKFANFFENIYITKSVQQLDFIKRIGTQSGGLAKIEILAGTKTKGFP
jgi:hypothetical protein